MEGQGLVEKITGADTKRWLGRAREFVVDPSRREAMRRKMSLLWENLAGRGKTIDFSNKQISEAVIENNGSGLETYRWEADQVEIAAVGVAPKNAWIEAHSFEKPVNGVQAGNILFASDKSIYRLITTAGISDLDHLNPYLKEKTQEVPLLGVAKSGEWFTPLINKSPGSSVNESESGGFGLKDGEFEVLKYSEMQSRLADFDRIEQGVFVVDNTNWREVVNLDAYANRPLLDIVGIGYFVDKNGDRRYFSMKSLARVGKNVLVPVFKSVEETGRKLNLDNWKFVCLDTGGNYSGMVAKNSEGKLTVSGPSFSELNPYGDSGHERKHFLSISWKK